MTPQVVLFAAPKFVVEFWGRLFFLCHCRIEALLGFFILYRNDWTNAANFLNKIVNKTLEWCLSQSYGDKALNQQLTGASVRFWRFNASAIWRCAA